MGALKGNQSNLFQSVQANFVAEDSDTRVTKGHGRCEKRVVSLCTPWQGIPHWPGLKTLIRVQSQRQFKKGRQTHWETETHYYIASFLASAEAFAERIRGYWGVENQVHYIRDVTQGEDASRIRMHQLPQIFAVARNLALNLYRCHEFTNMAQAQRFCTFGLTTLKKLFRMK